MRTDAPRWRVLFLPLAAIAFLALGGAALVWHLVESVPQRAQFADRIWFAGLVVTGAPLVWKTLRGMFRGHFASDVVAMLAVVAAIALREPLAGLVIVLMQSGGEALERYAEGRASAAVRDLEAAAPRIAHRVRDDRIEDLAADDIAVGDVVLVRPGELVPCDGEVVRGHSAVDVSRLTGEPLPLAAMPGTRLSSGSANGEGPLLIRATALARESQYARIVELVRTAQASKAPLQRLADRYAVWFTPITLVVCAAAWLWSRDPLRVLAVLVVATPCPLILATPIAVIGGINRAARRRIIVRHGVALEQLGGVTTAIFDKTGTLTLGHPEVQRVVATDHWSESELLRLAAAVEQGASHPLARTLVAAAERSPVTGVPPAVVSEVTESPGRGVTGTVDGHRVTVGARGLIEERHPEAAAVMREVEGAFAGRPGLRAWVAVDGAPAGVVEYADRVREDAHEVMRELQRLGVRRTIVLSGDHASNVQAVADEIGLTDARADLLPQDKVSAIRELVDGGERVLMVGDGTNDAPALSAATVGVALAAHGGGITAEAADVVLLADDLRRVPEAIRISRRTISVARQSLAVGLGLSAVAMVFAAFGLIRPTFGALLQEAIDVAVILNALRTSR